MIIYIYIYLSAVSTIELTLDMLNWLSKVLVLAVVLSWNPADMQLFLFLEGLQVLGLEVETILQVIWYLKLG